MTCIGTLTATTSSRRRASCSLERELAVFDHNLAIYLDSGFHDGETKAEVPLRFVVPSEAPCRLEPLRTPLIGRANVFL